MINFSQQSSENENFERIKKNVGEWYPLRKNGFYARINDTQTKEFKDYFEQENIFIKSYLGSFLIHPENSHLTRDRNENQKLSLRHNYLWKKCNFNLKEIEEFLEKENNTEVEKIIIIDNNLIEELKLIFKKNVEKDFPSLDEIQENKIESVKVQLQYKYDLDLTVEQLEKRMLTINYSMWRKYNIYTLVNHESGQIYLNENIINFISKEKLITEIYFTNRSPIYEEKVSRKNIKIIISLDGFNNYGFGDISVIRNEINNLRIFYLTIPYVKCDLWDICSGQTIMALDMMSRHNLSTTIDKSYLKNRTWFNMIGIPHQINTNFNFSDNKRLEKELESIHGTEQKKFGIDFFQFMRSVIYIESMIDKIIEMGFLSENIVLLGFCQGAPLALITGLLGKYELGGIVMINGCTTIDYYVDEEFRFFNNKKKNLFKQRKDIPILCLDGNNNLFPKFIVKKSIEQIKEIGYKNLIFVPQEINNLEGLGTFDVKSLVNFLYEKASFQKSQNLIMRSDNEEKGYLICVITPFCFSIIVITIIIINYFVRLFKIRKHNLSHFK